MTSQSIIDELKAAALEVLLHNCRAGEQQLPRTAAYGYPEPYTRDLMISSLGFLTTKEGPLIDAHRATLEALAKSQSPLGHIPSLANEPDDRGESDTTPLFLLGLAAYRRASGKKKFLDGTAKRALQWLEYQSPGDRIIVAQQPTSDWRDEQWVLGYGLYVNALVYAALRLFGVKDRARRLRTEMNREVIARGYLNQREHEGLALKIKPYFALWSYKVLFNDRFDLLGNSLAILTGIASTAKARAMVTWVERTCSTMRQKGDLAIALPPNLMPFIEPGDPDWLERYGKFNLPGNYHNGGVWPFICGFYIAALVAAGKRGFAKKRLLTLSELMKRSVRPDLPFGFNEWFKAQDGEPMGVDWQTWTAAMYLFAAHCVEENNTGIFDEIRAATGTE